MHAECEVIRGRRDARANVRLRFSVHCLAPREFRFGGLAPNREGVIRKTSRGSLTSGFPLHEQETLTRLTSHVTEGFTDEPHARHAEE